MWAKRWCCAINVKPKNCNYKYVRATILIIFIKLILLIFMSIYAACPLCVRKETSYKYILWKWCCYEVIRFFSYCDETPFLNDYSNNNNNKLIVIYIYDRIFYLIKFVYRWCYCCDLRKIFNLANVWTDKTFIGAKKKKRINWKTA